MKSDLLTKAVNKKLHINNGIYILLIKHGELKWCTCAQIFFLLFYTSWTLLNSQKTQILRAAVKVHSKMPSQSSYLTKLSCSKETVEWFSPELTLICFYKKMTEKTILHTGSNCKVYINGTLECLCNELNTLEDLVLWVQLYSFSNVGTVKCFCKSPYVRKWFQALWAAKWHLNDVSPSMGYQIFRSRNDLVHMDRLHGFSLVWTFKCFCVWNSK
jgi:hypothetical protein